MVSKQRLAEAEALVEFSNLTARDVETFRAKHPDFVPADWWTYRGGEQWKMNQEFLQDAWDQRFGLGMFGLMRLLESVFDPEDFFYTPYGPDDPHAEKFTTFASMREDFYPYQRAVLFLKEENWRVRICPCGKRYVADHPRRRYCAIGCPVQIEEQKKSAHSPARKKQKRKWWKRHGKAWRKNR
jgi:hypothetical protein